MMEKLFLHLCNYSIVAALAIIIAVVFRPILKKSPSFIRCALWCLIFLRLAVPVSFVEGLLPTPEIFNASQWFVQENEPTADTNASEVVANTDDTADMQGMGNSTEVPVIPPSSTVVPDNGGVQRPITPPSVVAPSDKEEIGEPLGNTVKDNEDIAVQPEKTEKKSQALYVLVTVWLCGAALMLVYMLASHILLRYRVRDAVVYDSRIRIIPKDCTPFVMGLVSPKIYIPSSVSKEDWKYIIAHENTHIKRLDHVLKPLAFAVLCVYWMNPLLWVAYAMLCKDIEYACDEKTVSKMEQEEKRAYSMALLSCSAGTSLVLAHPLAFGRVSVKDRIKRVMSYKLSLWAICIASLICVSIVLMVSCAYDSSISDGSRVISEESVEEEEPSQDHSSEESSEESSEDVVSESIDTENRNESQSTSDLVGGDAGLWTEFGLSPDEYIVWLEGKSLKTVRDTNGDYVNIHDCAEIEEMREFAKTLNLYALTLDGNKLQLAGNIYISFCDSSSLLIQYSFTDSKGRPLSYSIRYHDSSYGDALSGGIVNYWNVREKNEGRELINLEDYKIFTQSIYDHTSSSYLDTEVIMKRTDPRVRHFMYKTGWVEVFDGDSVFTESELDNIGFDYLWDSTHYAVVFLFDVNAIKLYPYPVTYDGTPQGLISALAEASGWRKGIEVNSFEIKDRVAYIDMNSVFGDQVYAGLMTESGVSCVVETLKYNYDAEVDYVALTIEGEPFKSSYD